MVPLCLYCQDESTNMQFELLGSTFDLRWHWPEVKYWPDNSKLPCMCFDAPWREEHDGARNMLLAFLVQKLFAKTFLPGTATLTFFIAPNAYTVEFSSSLTTFQRKNSLRAIECFFPGLLPKIVSEIMAYFWEEIWNFGKFDLWWPLVTSILTWHQNDLWKYCRACLEFLTLFNSR